jgi:CRP-like cAMP-binding protein/ActR/RegA family two-component response regulator
MSHTILLIEDTNEMRENISEILELAHYKVSTAVNGKEGVQMAQQTHPDLILCDVMMPELDGYGVVHILKSDPDTADIPFVFLTAKADRLDFRAGMNQGADDYVTKPFEATELLKVVDIQLKKNELLKSSLGNNKGGIFFNKAKELKDFRKLVENRPVKAYKKEDILFLEGQLPNDLFYIIKGSVKTYKINYDGKELITGIHRQGDFLGYVPLLEEKPYYENAEAMEEVKITIIPKFDFLTMIYSSNDFANKFIKMLSNNIEEMENRLLEIAYQSVRQRVANALLKISEQFDQNKSVVHTTRKDIANIVGTAIESLNRTLADFRDEGLIEMSGEGLKILNRPKLERVLH